MKRKTNLFYTTGQDSKFLTFSNYTESLTGNFLSTNTKLFPSAYLCLYIPTLTEANRATFIKNVLVAKYENRLAILRDYLLNNNLPIEENLRPLGYLIDDILAYDANTTITAVGNVTEQDYNGIYADTICVVNSANVDKGTIAGSAISGISVANSDNGLHGWLTSELPSEYSSLKGSACSTGCNKSKITRTSFTGSEIKFNVMIPLFDVVNINATTNEYIIDESKNSIEFNSALLNVPMGIWFAKDNITLTRDKTTGLMPSWSLVLCSQFKPIPNSAVTQDSSSPNNIPDAYATFAQALANNAQVLNTINSLTSTITTLSQRISELETQLRTIGTQANIDEIITRLNTIESKIN